MGCFGKFAAFMGIDCTVNKDEKHVTEIKQDRHCTDFPCCLAFLAGWLVVLAFFFISIGEGADLSSVTKGRDYNGTLCTDGLVTAWPSRFDPKFKVCVSSCDATSYKTACGIDIMPASIFRANPDGNTYDGVAKPDESARLQDTNGDNKIVPAADKAGTCKEFQDYFYGICQAFELPSPTDVIPFISKGCAPNGGDPAYNATSDNPSDNGRPNWWGYKSKLIQGFCIPDANDFGNDLKDTAEDAQELVAQEGEADPAGSDLMAQGMEDMTKAWYIILLGWVFSVLFSILFTFLLKKIAGCLVWTAILGILALGTAIAMFCYQQYVKLKDDFELKSPEEKEQLGLRDNSDVFAGLAIGFGVMTLLMFFIVLALRKRIQIAIEIVKEASRAVNDMKSVFLFPILPVILGVLYTVFWIFGAALLYSTMASVEKAFPSRIETALATTTTDSVGGLTGAYFAFNKLEYWANSGCAEQNSQFTTIPLLKDAPCSTELAALKYTAKEAELNKAVVWHFFHAYWMIQFFIYFAYVCCAMAIADWYFTKTDGSGHKIRGDGKAELSNAPIREAVGRTCKYHLGTIAFGSFLIAVIKFLKAVVKYLEAQSKAGGSNPTVEKMKKVLVCAILCCLKCVECCCDKFTKAAFVFTAVYGSNFLAGGAAAFSLMMQNILRTAAMHAVGDALILLCRFLIILSTVALSSIFLFYSGIETQNPWLPMLVIAGGAFLVSGTFMVTFETAMDTIFLCFLIDDADGGQCFASDSLRELIGKRESEETEAKRAKGLNPDGSKMAANVETTA